MGYEKYVSRKIIEAKPLEHDGMFFDPHTSTKTPFHKGDYSVIEDGKTRIEPGEHFKRFYQKVENNT